MKATTLPSLSHLIVARRGRVIGALGVALGLAAGAVVTVSDAEALVTRIVIDPARSQSPTFGGLAFGAVGQYEKLRGTAFGELDPADPQNAVITDIELAPRNSNGKVEYSTDIFILKPINLKNGNHRLFIDYNNRGQMRLGRLNDVDLTNNPTTAADAGTGFVMSLGYTIVSMGWDFGATGFDSMKISVPVATNPGGSPITGRSYEYIVFDNATSTSYTLTYPGGDAGPVAGDAHRARAPGRPAGDGAGERLGIHLGRRHGDPAAAEGAAATPFQQSAIYEFTYTAKNPVVAGIGLAATRDVMSFLRHASAAEGNPLAGDVQHTFSYSISQPSRTLNDFVLLGFNEDEGGRRVIDGILSWTGGGSGDQINYRFSQTGRTERNRQNHLYPEGVFPFAHQRLTDHLSGKTAGRDDRCTASNTCPKRFEGNFVQRVLGQGRLAAAHRHAGQGPEGPGGRAVLPDLGPVARRRRHHGQGRVPAVHERRQPVSRPSCVAGRARRMGEQRDAAAEEPGAAALRQVGVRGAPVQVLRPVSVPQAALEWPSIPGVTYNGLITTRYFLDLGAHVRRRHHLELPALTRRTSDLSHLRVEGGPGRQRGGRHPPAAGRGAGRDDHRLGIAARRLRRERGL